MSTTTELVYDQTPLKEWSRLKDDERKLKAARALQAKDHEDLWRMTEAYLMRDGIKGSKVSPLTLRAYRFALLKLLEHWSGEALLKVSSDEAKLYIRELEAGKKVPGDDSLFSDAPLKSSTVLKRVAAAKHFYEALRWAGLYRDVNPFTAVGVKEDSEKAEDKRSAYSLEEVVALFRQATLEDDSTVLLVFLLTVLAGLRVSEIQRLEWAKLRFSDGLIELQGKGNKKRFAPLSDLLTVTLKQHQARSPQHALVLVRDYKGLGPYSDTYLRKLIDQLCIHTFGIDVKTGKGQNYKALHSFRHTFGTEMHKVLPLFNLSLILGHNDIKTTAIYGMPTSKAAAQQALGKGRQKNKHEALLLKLRDEGVNALGILLFLSLPKRQQNKWQVRAEGVSPALNLLGSVMSAESDTA